VLVYQFTKSLTIITEGGIIRIDESTNSWIIAGGALVLDAIISLPLVSPDHGWQFTQILLSTVLLFIILYVTVALMLKMVAETTQWWYHKSTGIKLALSLTVLISGIYVLFHVPEYWSSLVFGEITVNGLIDIIPLMVFSLFIVYLMIVLNSILTMIGIVCLYILIPLSIVTGDFAPFLENVELSVRLSSAISFLILIPILFIPNLIECYTSLQPAHTYLYNKLVTIGWNDFSAFLNSVDSE